MYFHVNIPVATPLVVGCARSVWFAESPSAVATDWGGGVRSVVDIVNLDLKSTLRVLYNLFTKYKGSM